MKTDQNRKIGGHVSSSGGPVNGIKNALSIGGNCMQIFAGSPRMWRRSAYNAKDVEEFLQLSSETDIGPNFIHALYLTNLASDDQELRNKSKDALIMDMTNSSAIEVAGVVLHIGSHQGRGFDIVKDVVVAEILDVIERTPENSILLLENAAGQKGKIGSLEELAYCLDKLKSDRVHVCIDTAHAFEAGNQIHTEAGLEEYIQAIENTIGLSEVRLLHLNDSRTECDSRHDVHDNLGEGHIGIEGIQRIVNHKKLSHLPLILEVPGFDGEGPDERNIKIARSMCQV